MSMIQSDTSIPMAGRPNNFAQNFISGMEAGQQFEQNQFKLDQAREEIKLDKEVQAKLTQYDLSDKEQMTAAIRDVGKISPTRAIDLKKQQLQMEESDLTLQKKYADLDTSKRKKLGETFGALSGLYKEMDEFNTGLAGAKMSPQDKAELAKTHLEEMRQQAIDLGLPAADVDKALKSAPPSLTPDGQLNPAFKQWITGKASETTAHARALQGMTTKDVAQEEEAVAKADKAKSDVEKEKADRAREDAVQKKLADMPTETVQQKRKAAEAIRPIDAKRAQELEESAHRQQQEELDQKKIDAMAAKKDREEQKKEDNLTKLSPNVIQKNKDTISASDKALLNLHQIEQNADKYYQDNPSTNIVGGWLEEKKAAFQQNPELAKMHSNMMQLLQNLDAQVLKGNLSKSRMDTIRESMPSPKDGPAALHAWIDNIREQMTLQRAEANQTLAQSSNGKHFAVGELDFNAGEPAKPTSKDEGPGEGYTIIKPEHIK